MKRFAKYLLLALLALTPLGAGAVDISRSDVWSETDASNSSTTEPGFPENMAPSRVNDAARALMGAVTRFWNRINGTRTTTGSSNAYVITYLATPSTIANGEQISFKANFTNTGTATLNINSFGATTIVKPSTSGVVALAASDIVSGAHISVQYDSATDRFVVVGGLKPQNIGRHTIWIPASSMTLRTNLPATSSTYQTSTAMTAPVYPVLDFDPNYQTGAQFHVSMPKSWDLGAIGAQFVFFTQGTTGVTMFSLQCASAGNGDSLNVAFGSTSAALHTVSAATTQYISTEATGLTCSQSPSVGDTLFFQVLREAANTLDTTIKAASLLGVRLLYGTASPNDSE